MHLSRNATGETLEAVPSPKWRHPWYTTPRWLPKAKQWGATIEPGFVDGFDAIGNGAVVAPIFRATVAEQQAAGNPWENNPLTGKPFFSDPIFNKKPTPQVQTREVDLPIYLDPIVPLDFYGIGFDGDPNKEVPQFFLDRGAAAVPKSTAGQDAGAASPPPGLRLLRACDLWLHMPRVALTSDVSVEDGTVTGQANVRQTLSVLSPSAGDVLRVLQGAYQPVSQEQVDALAGEYTEINFDEILISTVYLLSPPNTPIGSDPDGSWQPFVTHNLFWNLSWAQPQFRILPEDELAGMLPVLAGGVAQHVINFLSASLNDAAREAQLRIAANSLAGKFWVPTGGGHIGALPVVPAAVPTTASGPDRKKNAAAREAALRAQRQAAQLDPDFPYTALPFPTSFLSAA